ncbi:hypothetical protein TELCIR_00638 [Teladorsagia circumcincta]|uniref:Major facilitator superfamily (MFS) profile domain-containing protein n=1 Tax=Teladorsagia circumcincta TaxID=45464 RepID=A0A2G9V5N2_TELCI|nr:hypothetical protein TELCIR_00638 [Teladorsagia circumcincta]
MIQLPVDRCEMRGLTCPDYVRDSIPTPSARVDVAADILPVPPDGGYGWVIVLAAFFSNLIVDGVCTSFTEFKGAYSHHFNASDASTALIGSLLIGVYLLVGIAFLISVAAPNIYTFMLIYGVVGGVGFGMIYLPAIVAVGYYFESKRAIATGIAVAGSGVGTMIMPFVCQYFITTIGWRYTVWILAGLVFLCALFGMLYRPLAAPTIEQKDHELVPLRTALRKMSEGDDYENRANSQMSNENDSPTKRYSRVEAENSHDDPVMARLRSALSECENDADTSPSTPVRPPLSPVLEHAIRDLHELGSRIGGSRLSRITGGLGVEDDDLLDDFYDSG